ncbi:glycosyltransferase [Weissella confusa]|uniref:glycosyltransferase family 2 protein n=1 Tax=Weissella confusa TaxID=1583 RepID=UPI0008FE2336|nr:glycosyltransferase family 2 protein [Weissella confusa]OJF03469.1 glycosyltransferase [Weissella confusa]
MTRLSIIVPVLNEQETVEKFYTAVSAIQRAHFPTIQVEYWFIDDGSSDRTLTVIEKLQVVDADVHYVSFSRNFGKEAALFAGLQKAEGDLVAIMDVDLQDPPELLPEMVSGVLSGEWDVIGARRTSRDGEPVIRSFFSRLFYKLVNRISDNHIVEGARDFRVMNRQVTDSILKMNEYNRFSKGIFSWVGFRQKYVEYKNTERVAGSSSWSFWHLVKYSIEGIVAFSQVPLMVVSVLGSISFVLAIIGAVFVILRALIVPDTSAFGWPSLVVVMLGIGGIQLLSLGVVGRYISSIYLEVKKRPIYIAKKVK